MRQVFAIFFLLDFLRGAFFLVAGFFAAGFAAGTMRCSSSDAKSSTSSRAATFSW
jgi:hypothetical protein